MPCAYSTTKHCLCYPGKYCTFDAGTGEVLLHTDCARASYSDQFLATECTSCPVGFVTASEGSWDAAHCYEKCDANFYLNDDQVCTRCPDGQLSPEGSRGIDACMCRPGYALNASGACGICPENFYAPKVTDGVACTQCPCEPCLTGKISTAGSAACFCPLGFTDFAATSTVCVRCPEGTEPASGGTCRNCTAGTSFYFDAAVRNVTNDFYRLDSTDANGYSEVADSWSFTCSDCNIDAVSSCSAPFNDAEVKHELVDRMNGVIKVSTSNAVPEGLYKERCAASQNPRFLFQQVYRTSSSTYAALGHVPHLSEFEEQHKYRKLTEEENVRIKHVLHVESDFVSTSQNENGTLIQVKMPGQLDVGSPDTILPDFDLAITLPYHYTRLQIIKPERRLFYIRHQYVHYSLDYNYLSEFEFRANTNSYHLKQGNIYQFGNNNNLGNDVAFKVSRDGLMLCIVHNGWVIKFTRSSLDDYWQSSTNVVSANKLLDISPNNYYLLTYHEDDRDYRIYTVHGTQVVDYGHWQYDDMNSMYSKWFSFVDNDNWISLLNEADGILIKNKVGETTYTTLQTDVRSSEAIRRPVYDLANQHMYFIQHYSDERAVEKYDISGTMTLMETFTFSNAVIKSYDMFQIDDQTFAGIILDGSDYKVGFFKVDSKYSANTMKKDMVFGGFHGPRVKFSLPSPVIFHDIHLAAAVPTAPEDDARDDPAIYNFIKEYTVLGSVDESPGSWKVLQTGRGNGSHTASMQTVTAANDGIPRSHFAVIVSDFELNEHNFFQDLEPLPIFNLSITKFLVQVRDATALTYGCKECRSPFYADVEGSLECKQCPHTHLGTGTGCVQLCGAGTGINETSQQCESCRPGFFSKPVSDADAVESYFPPFIYKQGSSGSINRQTGEDFLRYEQYGYMVKVRLGPNTGTLSDRIDDDARVIGGSLCTAPLQEDCSEENNNFYENKIVRSIV